MRWRLWNARPAVTLVEVLVVVAIMGILTSVAGLALPRTRTEANSAMELRTARRIALSEGKVVTVRFTRGADSAHVTLSAFPDGRVVADTVQARADGR